MNLSKIVAITLFALGASICSVFAYSNTDMLQITTNQEIYAATDAIIVGAQFVNTTGQSEIIPGANNFYGTVTVRMIGDAVNAKPEYYTTLSLVDYGFNGGMLGAHSTAELAYTKIPAGTLKAGVYVVYETAIIQSSALPPSTLMQTYGWKLITVK